MMERDNYSILKQVGILMSIETGGAVMELVIYFMRLFLNGSNSRLASIAMSNVVSYASWSLWGLRMLSWTLILALLLRLTPLCESFKKAQIWYLLRILFLILTPLSVSAMNYFYRDTNPDSRPMFTVVVFLVDLVLGVLAETLFLSVGNCAILFASAELLESFGMEALARKNRLCGHRLVAFTLAEMFLLSVAFLLASRVWIHSFMLEETDSGQPNLLPILIGFPAGLCVMVFRALASLRVSRTYRAIKELTQ